MTDQEAREDELLVLASIYDEDAFSASLDGECPGGQFSACMDLPGTAFHVHIHVPRHKGEQTEATDLHAVRHLPPVMLYFQLPADYPSISAPKFTLACKWLTLEQLSRLCQKLDEIWEENKGEVILFLWTNFLKDETFEYLGLENPLDLQKVVIRRKSKISRTENNSQPSNSKAGESVEVNANDGVKSDSLTYDSRAIQDIASQDLLLPALLEYDKEQQEIQFRITLFACHVCFCEKLGVLCIRFTGCDHVYCKDCMRGYFEVQIADGNVQGLVCPSNECESQAHPMQVKELVSAEEFSRYDRLLLQCSLDTMIDVMYCPRKICGTPVLVDRDSNMGNCPTCRYVFCIFCKLVYHGISPCRIKNQDLKKLRLEYLAADSVGKKKMDQRYGRRAIQQIMEESVTLEWLEEYSKQCPNCGSHIQKIDGCNKMTCTKCHSYFCWICKQLLSRNNPYHHFSSPQSPCFNQLFHGMTHGGEDEEEEGDEDWEPEVWEPIDWI